MKQSESIGNLSKALAAVQAALEPAKFNAANPFFKSKYADLASVFDACRHLLADNGLSVSQIPGMPPIEYGPSIALTTILMHESGEWLKDTMILPLAKAEPQAAGSAITYARRYALSAIIGIVADEDDDANQAQPRPVKQQPKKATSRPVPKEPATNGSSKVADLRATIDGADSHVTLGFVADRAAMTGLYKDAHEALRMASGYKFPASVKVEMEQKVSVKGALQVFDWLVEQVQVVE